MSAQKTFLYFGKIAFLKYSMEFCKTRTGKARFPNHGKAHKFCTLPVLKTKNNRNFPKRRTGKAPFSVIGEAFEFSAFPMLFFLYYQKTCALPVLYFYYRWQFLTGMF